MSYAPTGSTLYYSLLFSSPEQQQAISTIHAFYQEISTVMETCSDLHVAATKLQWWQTELTRTFEGQARHPMTQALMPVIQAFQLPIEAIQSLINHPNAEHLTKLIALYIPEKDEKDRKALAPYVQNLALSMQLMDYIIQFRRFSKLGLVPFALEELEQQAQQAQTYYQNALKALPIELRHSQLSQIIFAELQLKLLTEIQKDHLNVLTHKTSLTPLRKLWISWCVMRREKKLSESGC